MIERVKPMTDEQERQIYDAQDRWINRRFGHEAAAMANYGWGATEWDIATKVYGHGVLRSWIAEGRVQHEFSKFRSY